MLEITEQQIKYKDFDFQSGPTRNINISEMFMVTYENGQKEVFNIQTYPQRPYNVDLKREFDRIGTNDKEMLKFFKKNNFTKYYNDFGAACRMRKTGADLLAGGLVLSGCGIAWMVCGIVKNSYWVATVGYVMVGVGHVLIIASIPVSAVGCAKKRGIKNNFAKEYFGEDNYTYHPRLNLGYTGNGIGISLKF